MRSIRLSSAAKDEFSMPGSDSLTLNTGLSTTILHLPGSGPLWQLSQGCDVGLSHLRSA